MDSQINWKNEANLIRIITIWSIRKKCREFSLTGL
jgi:hypothetical protein